MDEPVFPEIEQPFAEIPVPTPESVASVFPESAPSGTMTDEVQADDRLSNAVDELREGGSFAGFRLVSNSLWIGGTAAGILAQERLGVPWPVTSAAIATSVTAIEYKGSEIARRSFSRDEVAATTLPENASRARRIIRGASVAIREVLTTGYAGWAGAMSAVEVNNLLGVRSTDARRKWQSLVYGVGVSGWSLPFMRETAVSIVEYARDNPIESTVSGAAGSAALYGTMKLIRKGADRYHARMVSKRATDTGLRV